MLPEALVIFACLNNTGCQETSGQYYEQNPEFREIVKLKEDQIKKALGPVIVQYWAPMIGIALGRESTARLSKHFYLTFKLDNQVLLFKQEF